jgi:hypothetical protein
VIVPFDDTLPGIAELCAGYPRVTPLPLGGQRTPAELRARAVAAATGEIVALLEDHCVPAADWCTAILGAHRGPYAGVGGAVDKGFPVGSQHDTALNWALYLTDYSRYMNPQPEGPAHGLTDTNSSYKRAALADIAELWSEEFHENVVNDRLRRDGHALWFAPDVIVHEQRTMTLGDTLRDRYSFGRLFASTRVEDVPWSRRLLFIAGSTIMPPLLVARVARNVLGRRRHVLAFVRALPALGLVSSVWIAGEMVGYLTGTPAPALRASGAAHPSPPLP